MEEFECALNDDDSIEKGATKKLNKLELLAKKTGRSNTVIYRLAKKLGRLPNEEEVLQRKNGRPVKYK